MVSVTKGMIINIQKFCLDDGPGIRTTIFMKGCTMDCAWCHNTESKSIKPQLSFLKRKCISCGKCAAICPQQVHSFVDNVHGVLWDKCIACGKCVDVCDYSCLDIAGEIMDVDYVIDIVVQDKPFYEVSNGGVTLSGGEPLMQMDFCELLLEKSKKLGIHTCIETAGNVSSEAFYQTAPFTDLYLFDYKLTDSTLHRKYTGTDNSNILRNLELLYKIGKKVILRCPIIPGINDNKEHLQGIADIYHKYNGDILVEIMPYHVLGISKLERFGMSTEVEMPSFNASVDQINEWEKFLKEQGVRFFIEKAN